MKISKIASLFLAGTVGLFIIGCGGGGNNSSSTSTTSTVSGSVVDGPIMNAKVCVDYNFNGVCDNNEPSAETNLSGGYVLTNVDLSKPYPIIVVPQTNTTDTSLLQIFSKKLSAPLEGNKININPITTLVGAQLYALKQENNLTQQAVEKLQEIVAQCVDLNNTNLTQVDIMQYPKVYAKAVALASILPDKNQSITEINNKIDFNPFQTDYNFTSCIKDENVSNIISQINNLQINNLKPEVLETIIHKAIEGNESILDQNQTSWEEIYNNTIVNNFMNNLDFTPLTITLNDISDKLVLTQDDSIIFFNNDGTYKEIDDDGETVDGNWNIQNNVLLMQQSYTILVAMKDKNASLIVTTGYDSKDGWWNDEAAILNATENTIVNSASDYLALFDPNTQFNNISESDFANQTKYLNDGEKYTFSNDGTFTDSWEENGETVTETGTWSVENNKVLVMRYNSGEDIGETAYVVSVGSKVVYIEVDANGKIVDGGVYTVISQ